MNKSLVAVGIAIAFACATPLAIAQISSIATGGSGGAGGSATGGSAAGGAATNSNTTTGVSNATGGNAQSGSSSASGGTSSATGGNSSAQGGNSSATGGNVGTVSTGGSSAQLGDVTVNYNVPTGPLGKAGLGVGVDETTGHIVTDNNFNYSGGYKLKNTPDVSLGGPASGPCNGFSGGIGLGLPGMSLGANMSTVDKGCEARETARIAAMLGRMDIANAVLEHISIVEEALRAKAARDAAAQPRAAAQPMRVAPPAVAVQPVQAPAPPATAVAPAPPPATTAPAQFAPPPVGTPVAQTQHEREAQLKEQQRLAQEALIRQATMAKVNDTLQFTDATTQGKEKTPQQLMAEEAVNKRNAQLAEENARKEAAQVAEANARNHEEHARKQAAQVAEQQRRNLENAAAEAPKQQPTAVVQQEVKNEVPGVSADAPNVQARQPGEGVAQGLVNEPAKDTSDAPAPKRPPPPMIDARNARDVLNLSPEPDVNAVLASSVSSGVAKDKIDRKMTTVKQEVKHESAESLKARALRALGLEEKKDVVPQAVAAGNGGLSTVAFQIP